MTQEVLNASSKFIHDSPPDAHWSPTFRQREAEPGAGTCKSHPASAPATAPERRHHTPAAV